MIIFILHFFSKGHEEKHHALNILNDPGSSITNHPSIPVLIRKARDYASNYYYNRQYTAPARDDHSYGAPVEPAYSAPTAPRVEEEDDDDEEILLIGVNIHFIAIYYPLLLSKIRFFFEERWPKVFFLA